MSKARSFFHPLLIWHAFILPLIWHACILLLTWHACILLIWHACVLLLIDPLQVSLVSIPHVGLQDTCVCACVCACVCVCVSERERERESTLRSDSCLAAKYNCSSSLYTPSHSIMTLVTCKEKWKANVKKKSRNVKPIVIPIVLKCKIKRA